MYKLLSAIFILSLSLHFTALASPHAINYQTVVRDDDGELLDSENIEFQFSILAENPGIGVVSLIYQETHDVTTNEFGLANLKIGEGTAVSGEFSDIKWGEYIHYLEVELDAGSGFVDMGTQQLVSVPYALHAESCNNCGVVDYTVLNVSCHTTKDIGSSYEEIIEIGDFVKQDDESFTELTFNGRVHAESATSFGIRFELRINGDPSSVGRARATIKSEEMDARGVPVTISGIFDQLDAGTHTVSIWAEVAGSGNTATGVMVDHGCWSTDVVIVKETY